MKLQALSEKLTPSERNCVYLSRTYMRACTCSNEVGRVLFSLTYVNVLLAAWNDDVHRQLSTFQRFNTFKSSNRTCADLDLYDDSHSGPSMYIPCT